MNLLDDILQSVKNKTILQLVRKTVGLANKITMKLVGAKRMSLAITIIVAGLLGWVKFYALPGAASLAIEAKSESYDLDIKIGDVTADMTDMKVNFDDIVWNVRGRRGSSELFTADRISFNLSIIKYFSSGFDLISSIHEVTVRDSKIHIEHKLSNRWNWQDAFNGKKVLRYINKQKQGDEALTKSPELDQAEPKSDDGPDFSLAAIHFDELGIVWVEELPSNSGGGLINRASSELFIDDVSLIVKNIVGIFQNNIQPMEIDLEGRTADGIIQASGEINLFSWGTPLSVSNGELLPIANNANGKLGWMPTLELDFYLENVGAVALGQMVPDSAIKATDGAISGEIQIVLNKDQVMHTSTRMRLGNMSWEVNEASTANTGKNLAAAKQGLESYRNKSVNIVTSNKGRISDPNFRIIPSLQTAITREAVSDAPKSVYRVATNDQLRYEDRELSPLARSLKKTTQTLEQVEEITTKLGAIGRAAHKLEKFLPF